MTHKGMFSGNFHSSNNYYPGGMLQPGRYSMPQDYQYGFNGQEKVNEISGTGNHNTALFWEYDTRLCRRWNQDPKPNPSISNYAAYANNPVLFSDPLGDTISVTPSNQGHYIEDLTAVFGSDASLLFEFDCDNNLTLTRAGQVKASREQSLGTNKGDLYKGVLTIINSEEVTTIQYVNAGSTFNNPETGSPFVTQSGQAINNQINNYGGESTITLKDAANHKIKDVSKNHIFISKDKVHSPGKYDDPRANNTLHGMGHVLYQNNSEQEKVIDFDNKSRRETGAPLRNVDKAHTNSPDPR